MKSDNWIKKIKAIGWDLDGTLYPADAIPVDIFDDRYFREIARVKNISLDKAKKEFEKKTEELGSETKALTALEVEGLKFSADLWHEVDLSKYLKIDKKIVDLFDRLDMFDHFILSNANDKETIKEKLSLIGLSQDNFKYIFSTIEIGAVKPDPKPFKAALKKMELSPEEVLFVGDRVKTDIVGARNVGMKTALVGGVSPLADVSLENVCDLNSLFNIR